jgi:antitoxin (DNA-binding transcriptional repressor) of toxin-antitoxin stability system
MKTATVRDLRTRFPHLEIWLRAGEEIRITKRGTTVARLVPADHTNGMRPVVDFAAQRKAVWGNRVFSAKEVHAMRQAELEGEEG